METNSFIKKKIKLLIEKNTLLHKKKQHDVNKIFLLLKCFRIYDEKSSLLDLIYK